jgi:hypothetical protein
MQILIFGDSFAADWTVKYPTKVGWSNLLATKYSVKNLAQAGVSEYKIYQQVMSVTDLSQFDFFIIAHTSPYRVVTRKHPVHYNDLLHQNSDLVLNDVFYHVRTVKGYFNRSLRAAKKYIEYHYDADYYSTTYNLFVDQINKQLPDNKTILIGNSLNYETVANNKNLIDCRQIQKTHPGLINHFSDIGNRLVYESIDNRIKKLI